MADFLQELKKRQVIKTGVIYAGSAFAVLQAAELFVDAFKLSETVFTVVAAACVLGLPAALIISWAFDIRPQDAESELEAPGWLSWRTVAAGTALLIVGILLGLAPQYLAEPDIVEQDTTVRRYEILLPEEAPVDFVGSSPLRTQMRAMAITPDGNSLIYAAPSEVDVSRLYLRNLDAFDVLPLEGTEGAYRPFISPNGKRVAFFAHDELRVVPIEGGPVRTIIAVPNPRGGVWLGNDRIMYADWEGRDGWVIEVDGASPTPVPFRGPTTADGSTIDLSIEMYPAPGGRLITRAYPPDERSPALIIYDPDTMEMDELMQLPAMAQAVNDAIVYVIGNDLLAVDYDAESDTISGEPRRVGSELRRDGTLPQYVISDKTLIYATGAPYRERQVARITADWLLEENVIPANRFSSISLSPDGTQLAATLIQNNLDIWLYSLPDGQSRRLTRGGHNHHPMWSDDGETIFFQHEAADVLPGIYRTSTTSALFEKTLIMESAHHVDEVHPGDIATVRVQNGNEIDYALLDLNTGKVDVVAGRQGVHEDLGNMSPDGEWMALTTDVSGRYEIIVVPLDGKGSVTQVSNDGGEEPRWSADMGELYWRYGTRLFRVKISQEGDVLAFSRPEVVYTDSRWVNVGGYSYWPDKANGGFLILRDNQPAFARSLRVVEGWQNIKAAP